MVTDIFSSLIAFTCINNVGRFNIHFTHYKEDNDVSKADEILQDELIKHTTRPSNTLFVMLMICKFLWTVSCRLGRNHSRFHNSILNLLLSVFSFKWISSFYSYLLHAAIWSKCIPFGNYIVNVFKSTSGSITFINSSKESCPANP